jgi:dihydrofolate reductase
MKVSIIAAIAANRGIGKDNDLLWNLPDDMAFFKNTTREKVVIMGRKNWESIPHKYRPLPNRVNIVISRNGDYQAEEAEVVTSLVQALQVAEELKSNDTFIIGGGMIYQAALDLDVVDDMYITHVDWSLDADVFFPEVDFSKWKAEELSTHKADDRHAYSFRIVRYSRHL